MQLSDPKGHKHTVVLEPGKQLHTHRGALAHDVLIGSPEGVLVESTGGTTYVALRPLLSDFVLWMPRGATVVYPKDAAAIVGQADIFPGPGCSRPAPERRAHLHPAAGGRRHWFGPLLRTPPGLRSGVPSQRRGLLRRTPPRLRPATGAPIEKLACQYWNTRLAGKAPLTRAW